MFQAKAQRKRQDGHINFAFLRIFAPLRETRIAILVS
jgi:hypothetical protein